MESLLRVIIFLHVMFPNTSKEAKARGAKWYFTGKPCARGHIDLRYARTRGCLSCSRVYRDEDAWGYQSRTRRWKWSNPDKVSMYNQTSRARRIGAMPEDADRQGIHHLVKYRIKYNEQLVDLDIIENLGKGLHLDHYVPLSKGGVHDAPNLWLVPAITNLRKHARTPDGPIPHIADWFPMLPQDWIKMNKVTVYWYPYVHSKGWTRPTAIRRMYEAHRRQNKT